MKSEWSRIIARALVLFAAGNAFLTHAIGLNMFSWIIDRTDPRVEPVLYGLIGLAVLMLIFKRDYYLPFLGQAAIPCGTLVEKVPDNATSSVTVSVQPGVNVIYWAAEANEAVQANPWVAYGKYTNAGVTKADAMGHAVLKIRAPASYHAGVSTLKSHVHYRTCSGNGMLSPVKTIYV